MNMEIKTKYNVGDTLWTIVSNKLFKFIVDSITVDSTKIETSIFYYTMKDGRYVCFLENECYTSKSELIRIITNE